MSPNSESAKPCRVLWIFRNFHPELAGGAERFRRYSPGLISRGVHVDVLTASAHDLVEDDSPVPRVFRIPRPQASPAKIDHLLVKHAARLVHESGFAHQSVQVGVVHWPDVPYFLWLKAHGVRIILICTIIQAVEQKKRSLFRSAFRWLTGVVTSRICDTIIVSSACMAESRVQEGAIHDQIKVISNGVDTLRFRPRCAEEKKMLRARLGIPDQALVLLYMGGIVPRKRIHLLIEALHHLLVTHPSARLYLIGPTQRPTMFHAQDQDELLSYQARLYELAGGLINRSIFFSGETKEPETWFSVADVFVFCPINEGFGNVIIESMSAATPVVMTQFIGLADELGVAGKHYLLADDSGESLADACRHLFDDEGVRHRLVEDALSWVHKKHSRDLTLDQLAAIYQGQEDAITDSTF